VELGLLERGRRQAMGEPDHEQTIYRISQTLNGVRAEAVTQG
jgi:hypothetical protein